MSEDVDKKLAELKNEPVPKDERVVNTVTHGEIVKDTKGSRVAAWLKQKAVDTATDVVKPMMQDLLYNAFDDLSRRIIYHGDDGYSGNGGRPRVYNGGYNDYGSYSSKTRARQAQNRQVQQSEFKRTGSVYDYRKFKVESLEDVRDSFAELNRIMFEYGDVSVGDLYRIIGQEQKVLNTDMNWGWRMKDYPNGIPVIYDRITERDENGRFVSRFVINPPEPSPLED